MPAMPPITGKLNKLLELSAPDRLVLISAGLLLPMLRVAITLVGFARVMRWVESTSRMGREASVQEAQALARLVNLAGAHVPGGATCLSRSVLLHWFLLRRGMHSQLRIGVRLTEAGLDAHAWVQYQGQLVNDRADTCASFLPFERPVTAAPRAAP